MSTKNPTHGTKVDDPNATDIHEGAGHVAKDSLAAESKTFSANRGSEVDDASNPAKQSITDADKLSSAYDAQSRAGSEKGTSYPEGLGGQSKATAVEDTTGSTTTGGQSSSAGIAPSYVTSHGKDNSGPHGKNITEGGFESDDKKNASFNQDIGGENDPGRLAEQKMAASNADAAGTATLPKEQTESGTGQYDALNSETSA